MLDPKIEFIQQQREKKNENPKIMFQKPGAVKNEYKSEINVYARARLCVCVWCVLCMIVHWKMFGEWVENI